MIEEDLSVFNTLIEFVHQHDNNVHITRIDGSTEVINMVKKNPNYTENVVDSVNYISEQPSHKFVASLPGDITTVKYMDIFTLDDGSSYVFNGEGFLNVSDTSENIDKYLYIDSFEYDKHWHKGQIVKAQDSKYYLCTAYVKGEAPQTSNKWVEFYPINLYEDICDIVVSAFMMTVEITDSLDNVLNIATISDLLNNFETTPLADIFSFDMVYFNKFKLLGKIAGKETIVLKNTTCSFINSRVIRFSIEAYPKQGEALSIYVKGYDNVGDVLFMAGLTNNDSDMDVRFVEYSKFNGSDTTWTKGFNEEYIFGDTIKHFTVDTEGLAELAYFTVEYVYDEVLLLTSSNINTLRITND